MPSLRDELVERNAAGFAALLDQPANRADTELATIWRDVLGRRDPVEILGTAVLWCSLRDIAGAVGDCVRSVVDRGAGKAHRAQLVATLDTIERYARGAVTIEQLWDAMQDAKSHVDDAITEAVIDAAGAAGGNMAGFDDEALDSAGRAVLAAIDVGGEAMRDAVVAVLVRRLPVPTLAALHAAHAARYP